MIKLAVFLGNFGEKYKKTRHNFAWLLCDEISKDLIWQKKFKGRITTYISKNRKVYILKPHTYMNNTGESVLAAMSFFRILPEQILVVHDDLELSFNKIALKDSGGTGGHNGLKSIIKLIGSNNFKRLRLGISRPEHNNISSYVLSNFTDEESNSINNIIEKAIMEFNKIIVS